MVLCVIKFFVSFRKYRQMPDLSKELQFFCCKPHETFLDIKQFGAVTLHSLMFYFGLDVNRMIQRILQGPVVKYIGCVVNWKEEVDEKCGILEKKSHFIYLETVPIGMFLFRQ